MIQEPRASRRLAGATVVALLFVALMAVVTIVAFVTVFQLPEAVIEQGRRPTALYEATIAISFLGGAARWFIATAPAKTP